MKPLGFNEGVCWGKKVLSKNMTTLTDSRIMGEILLMSKTHLQRTNIPVALTSGALKLIIPLISKQLTICDLLTPNVL